MVNVAKGKFIALAIALCALLGAVAYPAYALHQAHGDYDVNPDVSGVYEILCTLDTTAQGGTVKTGVIYVPAGSTADACLTEMVNSSESQNGLDAIHNYDYDSIGNLDGSASWTCTVYHADTQEPGTHTTHDTEGQTGDPSTIVLERYDNVVFTAE